MTNKEAMAELKAMPIIYPITNGENDRASRLMQARDMAIKALEQEPCDDAITREDALMCLTGEIKDTDTIETIIARFAKRIRKLPPVNPQPKSGEWIVHEKPHGIRYLECPYCNIWYLNEHLIRNSFCPNCGAKMVELQDRK